MIRAPKTQAEADALVYNKWAGHPQGTRYDSTRCAYEVWDQGRGCMSWQCSRKRGHGPDGLYCKTHAKMVMPNVSPHLRGCSEAEPS